jgi:hypothetical protein
MFTIDQQVKVTGVFAESFPGTYAVIDIVSNLDSTTVYILDQGVGGFDAVYLEAV